MLLTPKLLQACVAAYTDYHVWQLATQLFGRHAAAAALACQLTSWFNAYCLTRTFSSSCEAGLVVHALRHYLRLLRVSKPEAQDVWRWAALAALSTVMRPPSALFWAPAGASTRAALATVTLFLCAAGVLLLSRHGLCTLSPALLTGAGVVIAACTLDSCLYQRYACEFLCGRRD